MNLSRTYKYTLLCIFIFTCGFSLNGWSQNERIAKFIKADRQDAETLTKAYLKPLPSGVGANLNTGWFNTASTHHPLGFDIQIRAALSAIPDADQRFNVQNLNLENTTLADGESPVSPTAGGDASTGPEVVIRNQGQEVSRFKMPQGSGFQYVPAPMIQASVGLIKHTDLIIRFIPPVNIGDYGDLNIRGIGLKHSLSQWLPGGKLFPVNIAVMAGYTRVDINGDLNLDPDRDAAPDPNYSGNYDNQNVKNTYDTFTAKLIVGKDLPFLSVYGGLGYETSTMKLNLEGDYPVPVNKENGKRTETITDPFSYSDDGVNQFSLSAGLKFKLFFFHVFGEYSFAKYSVANAGIGFSFR